MTLCLRPQRSLQLLDLLCSRQLLLIPLHACTPCFPVLHYLHDLHSRQLWHATVSALLAAFALQVVCTVSCNTWLDMAAGV